MAFVASSFPNQEVICVNDFDGVMIASLFRCTAHANQSHLMFSTDCTSEGVSDS